MPSAGMQNRYLQGSVALTANLPSNSDDFDVLFTENVHVIDRKIIGLPPVWAMLNTEAGENNLLKFSGSNSEILNNRAEDVTYALSRTTFLRFFQQIRQTTLISTSFTIRALSRYRAEPSSPPTGARLMPATSAAFTSTSQPNPAP